MTTLNSQPAASEARSTRRLVIINGDDFGFSQGVNRAIIRAHQQGVLTSTSLMVTAEAAAEAVELARSHPSLRVGLHLVLVCGRSALPPAQIPHLVDAEGNFPNDSLKAGLRYQFSWAARQELRQEIRAQLERFRATGLPLSHVDGHLHLHAHPVVLNILAELADEFEIPAIRLPLEELQATLRIDRRDLGNKLLWSIVFGGLRRYGETVLRAKGIGWVDRVYGLLQSGCITEDYLLALIPQIQSEFVELYCHPALPQLGEPLNGPPGSGEAELAAMVSPAVRQALESNGFTLGTYADLTTNGP